MTLNRSFMHILRQLLRTLPFVALLWAMVANEAMAESAAATPVAIEKVRAFRDGDTFTAEVTTTAAWNGSDVQVKYLENFIQAEVSGAFLNNGKDLIRVEDRVFKSVYATQKDATTMRVRFFVKPGSNAKALAGKFHAKRTGSSITFEVNGDAQDASLVKTINENAQTIAVVDESGASDSMNAKLVAGPAAATTSSATTAKSEDINAAALARANEAAEKDESAKDAARSPASTASTDKKIDTNKLAEDQIPVLAKAKDEKKSEGNPLFRIITTLGVLAIVLGAAAFGVKKMAARGATKTQNTKIKVLTTHHLGPKKNLTIIQVAGETLLIGVTEQNISMLKTLSLLDDEIPEAGPQRFNHSIEDFAGLDEDEPIAMRGLDQIRDTVSARLRNMRNI